MPSVLEETVVVVAEEVDPQEEVKVEVVVKRQVVKVPSTEVPSTQTFLQETGRDAACISGGEKELISAQNLLHVLGSQCSLQSLQNEGQTSSARHKLVL